MPFLDLALAAAPSPALAARAAATVAALTAEVLGKDPRLTAVAVRFVDPACWYVAGVDLASSGLGSFFLEIRITEGTNTKDQKAAYVAAVFEAMEGVLGRLHPESYVHVHEARGDAYGYGGLTQEHRFIAGKLARR